MDVGKVTGSVSRRESVGSYRNVVATGAKHTIVDISIKAVAVNQDTSSSFHIALKLNLGQGIVRATGIKPVVADDVRTRNWGVNLETLQEQVVVADIGTSTIKVRHLKGKQGIDMVAVSRCCTTDGTVSTEGPDTTTKNAGLVASSGNYVASNGPIFPIASAINVNGPCTEER